MMYTDYFTSTTLATLFEKNLFSLELKTTKKPGSKPGFLMAGATRLELATPCVTGMYSNQLNYAPVR